MEVYVARQPIFDRRMKVYAYELLFRVGKENAFVETDGDKATSSVITNSFLVIGLDAVTRGRKAFINFTRNLLLDETATVLPKDQIVVEILEDIAPDKGIISACRKLKDLGYILALDDFVFDKKFVPLIKVADIIKVDFSLSDFEEQKKLMGNPEVKHIKFLAEKVETQDEYDQAKEMGYKYFQGYFFSKPVIISSQDIPGNKLAFLHILHEINKKEVNFGEIENVIKQDVSISYKFLRLINSAFFGFNTHISSIRQALVLLGINEFRKWISLIIMKDMGEDKPEELLVASVIRAKFCEQLAEKIGESEHESDIFFMGMFSLIDTFIGRPMSEILEKLPLAPETEDALLGKECLFRDVLNLIIAFERVDWETVTVYSDKLGIDQFEASEIYYQAIQWANDLLVA